MNFLKLKTSWSNIELGFLKICLVSVGIVIGLYFYNFLKEYIGWFFAAYVIAGIWTGYLWIKKMKGQSK